MKRFGAFLLALILTMPFLGVETAYAAVNVRAASMTVMAGTIGDASVSIVNETGSDITLVSVIADGGLPAYPIYEPGVTIRAGGSLTVPISVEATGVTGSANYTILVYAEYTQGNELVESTGSSRLSVNVTGSTPPPSATQTPAPPAAEARVDIVMTAPVTYVTTKPGQSATVIVTFKNNDAANSARDFSVATGMLMDFKNSFAKHEAVLIRAGQSSSFTLIITPNEDAKPGVYEVPFTYSYQGRDNKTYTGSGSVTVKVEEKPSFSPSLVIGAFNAGTQPIHPGDAFELSAIIANIGDGAAESAEVTVSGFEHKGITLQGADTAVLPQIPAGGSQEAKFLLIAHEDMDGGVYPIKFSVKYKSQSGESATFETSYYINITSPEGTSAGRGQLKSYDLAMVPGPFDEGDTITLYYTVVNEGGASAENIRISASAPDGIVPTNANIQLLPELVATDAYTFVFTFTPTDEARNQSYLIGITTEYETGRKKADGSPVVESFTQYASCLVKRADTTGDDQDRAHLNVSYMNSPSGDLTVGQSGSVTMTVVNSGAKTAKNVKVSGAAAAGIVPSSSSVQIINELKPGESKTITFNFMPTAEAKTQTYMVGFTIEYETGLTLSTGGKATDSFMQYAGINAYVPESSANGGNKSVPKVMISEYRITSTNEDNPLIVLAGQEFDLYLKVRNTHPEKSVKNIIVSLSVPETTTSAGNVFTPVNGSNSFYIDEIKPGEEFEKTLRMHCLNNAVGRNYVIKVTFNYEDDEGNPLNALEDVGVTVRQQAKMELGPINFPSVMSVGGVHYLSFYFRNMGYVTLRNLKVSAEGEGFDGSNAVYIVGNFGQSGYDYYDGSVTALEPGEHTLRIVAAYDLDTGEHIELVEEAVVTIMEDGGMDMMGMGGMDMMGGDPYMPGGMDVMDEEEPEGFFGKIQKHFKDAIAYMNSHIWIWFCAGGAVLLLIIILIVRKVRKNKAYSLQSDI